MFSVFCAYFVSYTARNSKVQMSEQTISAVKSATSYDSIQGGTEKCFFADLSGKDIETVPWKEYSYDARLWAEREAYKLCDIFTREVAGTPSMKDYITAITFPLPAQSPNQNPTHFTPFITTILYGALVDARYARNTYLQPLYKRSEEILKAHSFNQKSLRFAIDMHHSHYMAATRIRGCNHAAEQVRTCKTKIGG